MGIQQYKKQKIPDRSDQQKDVNRVKCATLYRKYRDREWILDDESYFTQIHSTINGNGNFYSDRFAPTILKAIVSENNWEVKTLHQLKVKINKCLKEVTVLKTFGEKDHY